MAKLEMLKIEVDTETGAATITARRGAKPDDPVELSEYNNYIEATLAFAMSVELSMQDLVDFIRRRAASSANN